MAEGAKRILVLGVGNILFTDEGTGVRLVEKLQAEYEFPENVTLMDGGKLGSRLMGPIMEADALIVADAVLAGKEPGTVVRLTGDGLRKSLAFKDSLHQSDLVDTLIYCDLAGHKPADVVVIGMEPFDYQTMSVELSPVVAGRLTKMAGAVLDEISRAGGTFRPKN